MTNPFQEVHDRIEQAIGRFTEPDSNDGYDLNLTPEDKELLAEMSIEVPA